VSRDRGTGRGRHDDEDRLEFSRNDSFLDFCVFATFWYNFFGLFRCLKFWAVEASR
jgi:hypothetical protein